MKNKDAEIRKIIHKMQMFDDLEINKYSAEMVWNAALEKNKAWEDRYLKNCISDEQYNLIPDKATFLASLPETVDDNSKLKKLIEWMEANWQRLLTISEIKTKATEILNQQP